MSAKFFKIFFYIAIILLIAPPVAYSLSVETHEIINEKLAKGTWNGFSLDNYLKSNLGLSSGISAIFDKKRTYDWIKEGGRYEDKPPLYVPYLRSVNHFHNPLATSLSEAGFSGIWDTGFLSGLSAIEWSQWPLSAQTVQVLGSGNYSWYDVRDYFHKALTSANKTDRENDYAETFRGLGQLMHLVEDMSVPEHARNDGHYKYAYEEYIRDNPSLVDSSAVTPIFFDKTALGQPSVFGAAAPVPIANLFDTNQYNGTNINVTFNPNIGLAEYTNANFFSPDTIFKDYPHPAYSDTNYFDAINHPEVVDAEDGKLDNRIYIKKTVGEVADLRLASLSYISYDCIQKGYYQFSPLVLDDHVYNDYAAMLIPRAVGYSAGLLDYFFRGNIEVTLPDSGIYAQTDNPAGFTRIKLLAENTTPNSEEMNDNNGSIELVVKYRLALEDPFINYPPDYPFQASEEFFYRVTPELNNTHSIPRDNPVELTFDLTSNPIPLWAIDVYLFVVYKGKLGNEEGAVAVGLKDISEPTPVDFSNDTDRICLNQNPVFYIAGSPEAIAQVDAPEYGGNDNQIADEWDVYQHDVRDIYIKFTPDGIERYASPTDYNFYINETIVPEEFKRALYILTDYTHNYNVYKSWINKDTNDPWIHPSGSTAIWPGIAIMNQTVHYTEPEDNDLCAPYGGVPCNIWWYPTFLEYRGYVTWGGEGIMFINNAYPVGTECTCYRGILRNCPAEAASPSKTEITSPESAIMQDGTIRMQSPVGSEGGIGGTMLPLSP